MSCAVSKIVHVVYVHFIKTNYLEYFYMYLFFSSISISADFANYSEEDILAQVIAQSQQEYLDNLKKNASSSPPPGDNHVPSCSYFQSDTSNS